MTGSCRICAATTLAVALALSAVPLAQAQEDRTLTSTEREVIAAIRRRAKQILEARRQARRLRFSGQASQVVAYENNPANASAHVGDTYLEEDLYLSLTKPMTPTLQWQGSYYLANTNYLEYSDGNYLSQTLTPLKFSWRPGAVWRVEGWVDLDHNWYPEAAASGYRQVKLSARVRQNHLRRYYHQFQYEWFLRGYLGKRARDGGGADTLDRREDARHRVRYTVGATLKRTLFSVENDWYLNDSNDFQTDFHDSQTHKVTASVNHPFTDKFSTNASYSLERKNYEHRVVTGITAEARYDETHTMTLQGTYQLTPKWSVSPKFTYKTLDSNQSSGEYADATGSLTVSASF